MLITTFKTKILLFFIFGMVILYSSFYYNALNGADDTFSEISILILFLNHLYLIMHLKIKKELPINSQILGI